ncbi:hypothetical protein CDN99_20850 [Roseateles aquatilis]|uniref:Abi-like protein n=1 Tax=Roseateles aquatilis TaxID=431061 RepID=A0A246J145_9BURK|nr:hypothetical protein CDN99_20850 [Roseateles aquatilis]
MRSCASDAPSAAAQLGVNHPAVLTSWMHAFNVTRNRAAHHARLWNRTNTRAPLLPPLAASGDLAFLHVDEHARKRLFGVLCCMRTLLRAIASELDWHRQLKALMSSFPRTPTLSIHAAGFPSDWETLPLWRD